MRFRISRRAPDTCDTELAAAAILIVMRAKQAAPGMPATSLDAPSVRFRVRNSLLYCFVWMPEMARHPSAQELTSGKSCRLTTVALLPFNRPRRLAGHVVDHPRNTADLVHDS